MQGDLARDIAKSSLISIPCAKLETCFEASKNSFQLHRHRHLVIHRSDYQQTQSCIRCWFLIAWHFMNNHRILFAQLSSASRACVI
jgi:hypothetical protein